MRTAVVTGASRGLGVALARVLAEEGCSLALGARDVDAVRAVADDLAAEHVVETGAWHLDVTDEDSLRRFRAEVVDRFGRVDLVVANAGVGSFAPIVDTDVAEVRAMFEVNVTGLLLTCKTFAADLLAAPTRGLVVAVTSDVSARVFPGGAAYVATKHAARAIARTFQQEHPDLRVCELRPGATATHFAGGSPDRDLHGHLTSDEVAETLRTAISLPDHVRVEELVVPYAREAIAVTLVVLGTIVASASFRRWASVEDAMRTRTPLPSSWLPGFLASSIGVLSLVAVVLLIVAQR